MHTTQEPKKISKAKEALLKNCVQLLACREWSDISIDDVEKHIKKTRGAIFHHYKTKDELLKNAVLQFISYSMSTGCDKESVFLSITKVLKDDFKVDKPEMAFFNIIMQAILNGISEIRNLFLDIPDDQLIKESSIIGHAFLSMIRMDSCN